MGGVRLPASEGEHDSGAGSYFRELKDFQTSTRRKIMVHKKWILLADANAAEADQTLCALAASHAPSTVVLARDGAEVLDCLQARNGFKSRPAGFPALVLLELHLPKVDGWEVLRTMRNDPRLKTIPIVVFTSSRDAGDLVRSYELGANAYVVKPAHLRQLAAVLDEVRMFWIVINEPPLGHPGEQHLEPEHFATAA